MEKQYVQRTGAEIAAEGNIADETIYESMALRTGGDIYIGVVGPVRTGKSTFIKRFMDLLVVPNVSNIYVKQRILDELPQSGSGKTIMTAEPKFIPAEAVTLSLPDRADFRIRLVDCVGYLVNGALGHTEDGKARMVSTPWDREKLPFEQAAELGTRKVMEEHSTVGIVVTTDGTICGIDRENYIPAEERVITEMKELGKPFAVILNSAEPESEMTGAIAADIRSRYNIPVLPVNCARMSAEAIHTLLADTLYQFPAAEIRFHIPAFVEGLPVEHWIKTELIAAVREWSKAFETLDDIRKTVTTLANASLIKSIEIDRMDLSSGNIDVRVEMADGLYYKVIEELTDETVRNDYEFFALLKDFAGARKAYDKLKNGLAQVEATGYGIVQPRLSEMILEEPEIFKQGNKFGVRIVAKAPSLHIIRTDITTEVAPVVGTEKQSEELLASLLADFETDRDKLWDTNIFGKTLQSMVLEQMENKISGVPGHITGKVQRSLQKISDEGKEYFICIIL